MISGRGSSPSALQRGRGLRERAHLHREQARDDQAEAHAAQADHRVLLVQPADGVEQLPPLGVDLLAVRLGDRDLDLTARVRSGRNSCSGGSSRRTVTGQPVHRAQDADEVLALQRQQRGERLRPAPPSPSARTRSSTSWRRSPRNMCSVRHSPMPSAPKRRARSASSGVSALVRTPSRRVASACADEPVRRPAPGRRRPSASSSPSKYSRPGSASPAPRRGRPRRWCRRSTGRRPRSRRCSPSRDRPRRQRRPRAPPRRRRRSCPCRARRPPRGWSCRRGW